MPQPLPANADVVIVGGGIIGCSIAYHLVRLGITNVALLERRQLTCGTTWHAAGLVGQLRASRNLTELARYTTDLFRMLEAETGQATGFKQNGSISVALTDGRLEEFKRGASMAKSFGLEVRVITPGEIRELWPHIDLARVTGGIHLPNDGQVNPIDVTQAYAAGARQRGAKIFENTPVTRILIEDDRAVGVETEAGSIRADAVVIAAGMWSRDSGRARRRPAAPCGRALLHSHPAARRPGARPAGHARARRMRLLQGGCRQAHAWRLRARCQALGHERDSGRLLLRLAPR